MPGENATTPVKAGLVITRKIFRLHVCTRNTQMDSLLKKCFQDVDISLSVLQVLAKNSYDSILITDATKDAKIIYTNKAFF